MNYFYPKLSPEIGFCPDLGPSDACFGLEIPDWVASCLCKWYSELRHESVSHTLTEPWETPEQLFRKGCPCWGTGWKAFWTVWAFYTRKLNEHSL